MKIGELKERITLQKSHTIVDKNGNHVVVWKDTYSCFAYANNLSGTEYWAAAQVSAQADLYFLIRYCEEVKNLNSDQFRIVYRNKIYNITFVDHVQYKNQIVKVRASLVKR